MVDYREMSDEEFKRMMEISDRSIDDSIAFADSREGQAVLHQFLNSAPMGDYSGAQWFQSMESPNHGENS